jgi:hypothetical protein
MWASVVPQLKEKIINEIKVYLLKSLEVVYTVNEKKLCVPIFAQLLVKIGRA